jgi:hypothetical protein
MTRSKISTVFFCLTLSINSIGQTMTFDNFKEQLFLNANLNELDTSLIDYYKQNNSLQYGLGHVWTSMAEGIERAHFFYFKQHPLLPFSFRQGKIELDSYKTDTTYSLTNLMLFLEFAKKSDAEKVYEFLVDNFSKLSTRKKLLKEGDVETAVFTNANSSEPKAILIEKGENDNTLKGYTIVIGFGSDTLIDDIDDESDINHFEDVSNDKE